MSSSAESSNLVGQRSTNVGDKPSSLEIKSDLGFNQIKESLDELEAMMKIVIDRAEYRVGMGLPAFPWQGQNSSASTAPAVVSVWPGRNSSVSTAPTVVSAIKGCDAQEGGDRPGANRLARRVTFEHGDRQSNEGGEVAQP